MIRNSYSDLKTDTQKFAQYMRDKNKKETVYAYKSDGSRIPLNDCRLINLEHVAGLWRIQDEFPYEIEIVRGKPFVIGKKLPHTERTLFDFYEAFRVCENCYGKYLFKTEQNYIVAKTVTSRGTFSSYGKTIEDVRAYLGIKLCDVFQDVIRGTINSQLVKTK